MVKVGRCSCQVNRDPPRKAGDSRGRQGFLFDRVGVSQGR